MNYVVPHKEYGRSGCEESVQVSEQNAIVPTSASQTRNSFACTVAHVDRDNVWNA